MHPNSQGHRDDTLGYFYFLKLAHLRLLPLFCAKVGRFSQIAKFMVNLMVTTVKYWNEFSCLVFSSYPHGM